MSDRNNDLVRRFEEDVEAHYPRSIGLFPIPEYPELESRGMWSAALDALLTTLRYLAPATLLTLFWGQQSFFFTILRHIDNAFRAIVFSSEEQKQAVLQWLEEAGSVHIEHLDTVWRHGWILCSVLDTALPGACAGHPPTRLSLKHAQTIADHYLGVEPVFSRQELETNDTLSRHQEWRLATYLERVRQALTKIAPPVSKPNSQRTSPETTQFTYDYVAKGSGLTACQVNHKMSFKIYPTAQQTLDPGEVTILIRGPKDTYGMTVLPPILGKSQKIRQKILGLNNKQTYTENALPITQGATYLRTYGKNDMNKTYYIPKSVYDVDIEVDKREDHVKVSYTVTLEGRYEISITSRGLSIVGSPFIMSASNDIIGILEKENFCLEDGEEIDIVDVKTDRKVVLRIVDFVTEKMLLREDGILQKISEDEARMLMSTDIEAERSCSVTEIHDHVPKLDHTNLKSKFNEIAQKIIRINRVCKVFNDLMEAKYTKSIKKENLYCKLIKKDIPDIVNSTFNEVNSNPFIITEKVDKYIVPENISVSIRTEIAKPYYDNKTHKYASELNILKYDKHEELSMPTTPDSLERILEEEQTDEETISLDRSTPLSNNPFLTDVVEDFAVEKKMGTFVKSEYERNNSQNEETENSSIQIVVDTTTLTPIPSPRRNNPFIESIERPKTPIYKIITGDLSNRIDSPYLDPNNELNEEALTNEFVNPFFVHQFQSKPSFEPTPATDFIIGAPVSLPPVITVPSPGPPESLITTTKDTEIQQPNNKENVHIKQIQDQSLQPSISSNTKLEGETHSTTNISLHSFDSNLTDPYDNSNCTTASEHQYEPYKVNTVYNRDCSPRKDIWDSAYVSIDDNNTSPDNNNNDNTADTFARQKFSNESYELKEEEISGMGPAERELWQSCTMLKANNKIQEESKPYRWEVRRPIFTPIIEESDRSISSSMKESSLKHSDIDTVSVAFAELNDVYEEYAEYSETSSSTDMEPNKIDDTILEHTNETDDIGVESASEILDVIRHERREEGTISEVQANVTESDSASQYLQEKPVDIEHFIKYPVRKHEIQFGDKMTSNIVLEKKQYWDEKIRQIEEKTQESTKYQKKKRISTKQLKPDSLSKRKGKQMLKNFLNVKEQEGKNTRQNNDSHSEPQDKREMQKADVKLVNKWKKYWDDKLEVEHYVSSTIAKPKLPKDNNSNQIKCDEVQNSKMPEFKLTTNSNYKEIKASSVANNEITSSTSISIVKQELPEEEVFKAFETSLKRFFGTSRKQILSKIDTFLGKPSSMEEDPSEKSNEVTPDSGLVSSRISLFHNMTNTEPLPWKAMKSHSMHDIHLRKDIEPCDTSIEVPKVKEIEPQNKTLNISKEHTEEHTERVESNKNKITLKEKRARMTQKSFNKSFDDSENKKSEKELLHVKPIQKFKKDLTKPSHIEKYKKPNVLRRTSISKSELDLFSKVPETNDVLEKHRSYDELPKINVKSFISMYENVSKTSVESKPAKGTFRPTSVDTQNHWKPFSVTLDAEKKIGTGHNQVQRSFSNTVIPSITSCIEKTISESISTESINTKTDTESVDKLPPRDKETTYYMSLSDIELEIIESSPDKSIESSPERTDLPHIDYKNRFNKAKQFFQSLEELREPKKPRKPNECEMLLLNELTESLEPVRPPRKPKKKKTKSHSMPSSELAKYWTQMQEQDNHKQESTKLVKISEKFNVDDLFSDVMEGRLSRQGSLRGIPHKKAVLEAFKSMENITDSNSKNSAYESSSSEFHDFVSENRVRDAQNYLSEYPYLPTTDPSKYHSRVDVKASGLITLKELLQKKELLQQKVRRNRSVPDLRMNAKFSVDL